MSPDLLYALFFLVAGLLLGGLAGWLLARLRLLSAHVSRQEVQEHYVPKALFHEVQNQLDVLQAELKEKESELRDLLSQLAADDQRIAHLLESQQQWERREQERVQLLHHQFESLANRLLEEKSKKFTDLNIRQMGDLLSPLRDHLKTFESQVQSRFVEETRDRVSLKKEIEQLRQLNQQLSQDATNLALALKGDTKAQGDWGEVQLERLLERSGLLRDVHYRTQASFADEDGRQKRPDFIIQLPEDKHLIIDAKVSLTAYERYHNSTSEGDKQQHLRAHVESIRRHIRGLSGKDYHQLYQINTPDYILLFIPLEGAFSLAIKAENGLFTEALERNIVLVTTSTLLATLRTVSFLWKQEKQKRNVLEIARQSGLLYDKFVGFVEDLQVIGQRLDQTQQAYLAAMHKLREGKRYGDTLIGRAEKVKKLGAEASKSLPEDLLPDAAEEGQQE